MKYLYCLLVILVCGCYSQKKANKQFQKAATNYPEIPAAYCANEFPVKDSTITDTLTTTDTLYVDPLPADTVMIQDFDTVRVYITKTLPAKIVTNTIHIRDTIFKENTAALKACEMDKSVTIALLEDQTAKADKYQAKANKRGWIMWGLIALIIAYIALRIYLKFKTNAAPKV